MWRLSKPTHVPPTRPFHCLFIPRPRRGLAASAAPRCDLSSGSVVGVL